jgi:hypothetical protein
MPTNNYGPWYTTASGGGSGAVSNPSLQNPPQSPSGSVSGQSATWNYSNSETSTQYYLDAVLNVDAVQQGANAISNLLSITSSFAGIPAAQLQVNNFTAGSYGTTGNKFS